MAVFAMTSQIKTIYVCACACVRVSCVSNHV